jgi:thiamine pyrophosphate-dependent acetolactate synthase large subunit-like protein
MIRKEAMKIVLDQIDSAPIISANGFMSRDLFELKEKTSNFYMIGSMGLASSIGLGIALKNPRKKIYVFDGDGNILMNLGSLVTIGSLRPKNMVHIIFDNNSHESTGGQPTVSNKIQISKFGQICNYKVFAVETKNSLKNRLTKIKKINQSVMIVIKISKSNTRSQRVSLKPEFIKKRFMKSLNRKN